MQGPGVQIMNTDPFVKRSRFDPGIHITLHDDGVNDIYDSAQGSYLRSSVVKCLAKYIPTKNGDSLTFRFILCDNGTPRVATERHGTLCLMVRALENTEHYSYHRKRWISPLINSRDATGRYVVCVPSRGPFRPVFQY